ncbi:hypothetical protein DID77_02995, partial [Candidatus Marinamargulisbacteria bacterium SCGC AG-439-L15]
FKQKVVLDTTKSYLSLVLSNYKVSNAVLYEEDKKRVRLNSGKLKANLSAMVFNDELSGRATLRGTDLALRTKGLGINPLSVEGVLKQSLTSIRKFTVGVNFKGSGDSYDISVTSPLDKIFSKKVSELMAAKLTRKKEALKSQINGIVMAEKTKVSKTLGDHQSKLEGVLSDQRKELDLLYYSVNKQKASAEKRVEEIEDKVKKKAKEKVLKQLKTLSF